MPFNVGFHISDIVPPSKPLRVEVGDIDKLAESIRKIGLLRPIVVRTNSSGSFEILSGNRRFNACKKLGWRKITCHVVRINFLYKSPTACNSSNNGVIATSISFSPSVIFESSPRAIESISLSSLEVCTPFPVISNFP